MATRRKKARMIYLGDVPQEEGVCGFRGCKSPLRVFELRSPYRGSPTNVSVCSRPSCAGSLKQVAAMHRADVDMGEDPKPRDEDERQQTALL